jgi:tetratricopeptide (TPR) repeat protein
VLALACAGARAECPPLNSLYPATEAAWPARRQELETLMPVCLESAEYFALLGAARLNTNDLPGALEALERALLLDPNHGGARIDYAEALHRSGQLFAALELNGTLVDRADLPPDLQPLLRARQAAWNRERRVSGVFAEVSMGYDTNLNGAPSANELVLTFPGLPPVLFPLLPASQPKEGAYANARVVGSYAVVGSDDRHDLLFSLRARGSNYGSTDLVQADWRYGYSRDFDAPRATRVGWELTTGTGHVLFGGSPLYSVLDLRNRFVLRRESGCSPLIEASGQYQRYHEESTSLSGVESSLSGGLQCQNPGGRSRLEVVVGYLMNEAIEDNRRGGDREGPRLQMRWVYQLGQGSVDFDAAYARLRDEIGYDPLFNKNETRVIDSYQVRLQYQRPLNASTQLFTSLNHRHQGSNLEPFRNEGTSIEAGLRYQF